MTTTNQNLRYTYFRVQRATGRSVVCAVIELPAKGTDTDVKVSFSSCSANDTFKKSVGRAIAKGRLDAGKFVSVANERIGLYNLALKAAEQSNLPGWFKRAVNSGKVVRGLSEK